MTQGVLYYPPLCKGVVFENPDTDERVVKRQDGSFVSENDLHLGDFIWGGSIVVFVRRYS